MDWGEGYLPWMREGVPTLDRGVSALNGGEGVPTLYAGYLSSIGYPLANQDGEREGVPTLEGGGLPTLNMGYPPPR